MSKFTLICGFALLIPLLQGHAQERPGMRAVVTYVASGSIYIGAGREKGVAEGDTLLVQKGGGFLPGIIVAVSGSSAAGRMFESSRGISPGDSVLVLIHPRKHDIEQPRLVRRDTTRSRLVPGPTMQSAPMAGIGEISGRVALQYTEAGFVHAAPSFAQPSLVGRLSVGRLWGSAMRFSMFARLTHNSSGSTYGDKSRYRLRVYDFSLSYEDVESPYAWSTGRVTSPFVGGLGEFDGAQFHVRRGGLTVGGLFGFQPDYRTSAIKTTQQKGAVFINYGWEPSLPIHWDVTLAYARQLFKGNLDRDFVYVQNSLRLWANLYLYQGSEIDLHRIRDNVVTGTFRLANTFISLSCSPLSWLNVSGGYDASRSIYLLESMRWLPDTLLDQSLRQGYRASLTVRVLRTVSLSGWGRFSPATARERASRSAGGSIRIADVFDSGIGVGAQYAKTRGYYTDGKDLSLDADARILEFLSIQVRLSRVEYTGPMLRGSYRTTTLSGSGNVQFWRNAYAMAGIDRVWESFRDSHRLYLEIGTRL